MNGADGDGLVLVECSGNEFEGICLGGGGAVLLGFVPSLDYLNGAGARGCFRQSHRQAG